MDTIKIGSLTLGHIPAIVVPLTDTDVDYYNNLTGVNMPGTYVPGAYIIELRIDMFNTINHPHISEIIQKAHNKFSVPIIATCRDSHEGGKLPIADALRQELLILASSVADAIDVEINAPIAETIIATTVSKGKIAIASFHDFKTSPTYDELCAILRKCKAAGAHITKIAVTANNKRELQALTQFTLDHADDRIVTIAMGNYGAASRVFLPLIGSLFTFATIGTITAPGQLPVGEIIKYMPVEPSN